MKRIVRGIGFTAVILLALVLCLSFFLNANQFRPLLQTELTKALGREVKLGDLKLSLLSGGVTAGDLSVADNPSFSKAPFLRAKSLDVRVELMPLLLSRQLNVTAFTIEEPDIVLLQSPSGEWNFSTLGAKSSAPKDPNARLDLSAKLVKITSGRLSVGSTSGHPKPHVYEKLNAELEHFSAASEFPFSLSANFAGGGEIKLKGKAGPINKEDAALTAVNASLSIAHLDLLASGLADPSSGFAGILALEGSGSSNGRQLQANGRIKAEHWKLAKNGSPAPRPLEFDFAVEHEIRKRSGVLSRGTVHMGKVNAALSGTYNLRGESPVLNMRFTGTNMPVPELGAMLPALGVVLPSGSSLQGGTARAQLLFEGPADRLVASGSVSLHQTRLAGFDLGSNLKGIAALTGIKVAPDTDIEVFSADVRRSPEGTRLDAINLVVPAIGDLTGAGTVSPSQALDFKMRVKLHTSGNVMAALGQKGDTTIPFFITGTGSAPRFVPDVQGIAAERVNTFLKGDDPKKAVKGILDNFFGRKKSN